MIKTVTKTKSAGLFILFTLLTLFIAGCSKEAPEVDAVDLAPAPNLFEEPIQPNPLAMAAEDVVISVEGEDITHGDIMQAVQMRMMQLSRQVPPQQLSQLYPQVYQEMSEMLVANILLTKAAEKSSLAVSDEEVAEEIAKIEANAPEEKTLQDMLAENEIDFAEWQDGLRSQILVGKLVEEQTAGVEEATAVDAADFYQENIDSFKVPEAVTASHILMAFTPEDTDVTKAKKKEDLAGIRAQILAGGSFEELAAEHSDCPSSQRGGNLGSFGRGQMVPEFDATAFILATGDLSDIVETQFGYHLIKVTDHQAEGVKSLGEVKEQLQAYLTAQKKQEALIAYIGQLKEKAEIVTHRPDFDAAAE